MKTAKMILAAAAMTFGISAMAKGAGVIGSVEAASAKCADNTSLGISELLTVLTADGTIGSQILTDMKTNLATVSTCEEKNQIYLWAISTCTTKAMKQFCK